MLKEYIFFAFILTIIDSIYLTSVSKFFNKQVRLVQNQNIKLNPISTVLCYLLLTSGLFYFSIVKKMTLKETFMLGIFVYGIYELTNHAILKNWKWETVILDTIWGGILFSLSVYIFNKAHY